MPFTDDRGILIRLLQIIRDILERVTAERIAEDKDLFLNTWFSEVKPGFQSLIQEIEAIPSEENSLWRTLHNHGFSGEQLRLKATRFFHVLEKGPLKKILDIINTILSSIPGADPIREYKELAEGAVDDLNASFKL
jgi:hypothetical protein